MTTPTAPVAIVGAGLPGTVVIARRANRRDRHSVRLPGYDYRQAAAYFITVCAHARTAVNPFGKIVDGAPELTATGRVVQECWAEIPGHFPFAALDAFVIMPDHIHGIVVITEAAADSRRGDAWGGGHPHCTSGATHAGVTDAGVTYVGATIVGGPCGRGTDVGATHASPLRLHAPARPRGPVPGSVAAIVGSFKAAASRRINLLHGTPGAPVWQRNYYERIIRDHAALEHIRRYIAENPRHCSWNGA